MKLRDYQIECLETIKSSDKQFNLAMSSVGSGKTIIFSKLASDAKGRVLILVPSTELREQSIEKLEAIDKINTIGSVQGNLDDVDAKIVVATRQSLIRGSRIYRMLEHGEFEYLIVDECLVGDTLITLEDGGFEYIENIKNGDKVYGGEVADQFSRDSEIWKLDSMCGSLEGSSTHPTFVIPYEKVLSNKNKVFTYDDFEVKPIKDIKQNDYIPVLRKIPHTEKTKWTEKQLSFVGLIQADGHLDQRGYRIKVNVTKDKEWYEKVFTEGVKSFGDYEIFKNYDCRGNLTLTVKSKELKRLLENVFEIKRGKKSDSIAINKEIQYAPLSSIKSFIETVYNCEGDLNKTGNTYRININMTSKYFIQCFQLLLRKFGIIANYQEVHADRYEKSVIYRLSVGSHDFNKFMETFNLLDRKITDKRNYGSPKLSGYDVGDYKLVKVKKSYNTEIIKKVYDYTTTTHQFIANGLLTHNCHQAPKSIKKIIKLLNKDVKVVGFTATPYTKECIKIFGEPIFKRTMMDMIEQDYLIEPRAILVESKTDLRNVRTQNGDFIVSDLEDAVNNIERNLLILESYRKYAEDRKSVLIFATGVDHAQAIYQLFKSEGINVGYVDGNTDKEERKLIIDKFKKMDIKVLVNVLALTTGFDAVAVDTLIIARPTKSRILWEQILGRGLRLSPDTNKTDCLVIDVQDVTRHHDLMNLSATFNVNMKTGETPRQAKKRITEEDRIEKERQQQELLRKQGEEHKRKEQLELRAKEIKLFNKEMSNTFSGTTYDWFKVDNMTWALKVGYEKVVVIEQNDDTYDCYGLNIEKDNKSVKFLLKDKSLINLIHHVESSWVKPDNQSARKDAKWKMDKPSDAQLKYCGWARNRGEVDKYFTSNTVKGIMKKYHLEH